MVVARLNCSRIGVERWSSRSCRSNHCIDNATAMLLSSSRAANDVNVSALKIHMSEDAHRAINAFPEFITDPRGEIFVKVAINLY